MSSLTEMHSWHAARQDILTNVSVEASAAGCGSCHMSKNKKPFAAMASTSCQDETRCKDKPGTETVSRLSTCVLEDAGISGSRPEAAAPTGVVTKAVL